jgi:uncharacterized protein (TIGR02145 family)
MLKNRRLLLNMWLFVAAFLVFSCSKDEEEEDSFTAPLPASVGGGVTDIQGNEYPTIIIGEQEWMAENLKVTQYRNGDALPIIADNTNWSRLDSGAYSLYANNAANFDVFGPLYNGYAILDPRGICPEGWRVPTDADWQTLERNLGMLNSRLNLTGRRGGEQNEGGRLKLAEGSNWASPNLGANNETGFAAIAGGQRLDNGTYRSINSQGSFWSSTSNPNEPRFIWYRFLRSETNAIGRVNTIRNFGFNCRCVK